MDSEWRVRLLRAWFYVRELLGHPKRLTAAEHDTASATTVLAGSPWVWVSLPSSSASGTATFSTSAVTNTTWPLRRD